MPPLPCPPLARAGGEPEAACGAEGEPRLPAALRRGLGPAHPPVVLAVKCAEILSHTRRRFRGRLKHAVWLLCTERQALVCSPQGTLLRELPLDTLEAGVCIGTREFALLVHREPEERRCDLLLRLGSAAERDKLVGELRELRRCDCSFRALLPGVSGAAVAYVGGDGPREPTWGRLSEPLTPMDEDSPGPPSDSPPASVVSPLRPCARLLSSRAPPSDSGMSPGSPGSRRASLRLSPRGRGAQGRMQEQLERINEAVKELAERLDGAASSPRREASDEAQQQQQRWQQQKAELTQHLRVLHAQIAALRSENESLRRSARSSASPARPAAVPGAGAVAPRPAAPAPAVPGTSPAAGSGWAAPFTAASVSPPRKSCLQQPPETTAARSGSASGGGAGLAGWQHRDVVAAATFPSPRSVGGTGSGSSPRWAAQRRVLFSARPASPPPQGALSPQARQMEQEFDAELLRAGAA